MEGKTRKGLPIPRLTSVKFVKLEPPGCSRKRALRRSRSDPFVPAKLIPSWRCAIAVTQPTPSRSRRNPSLSTKEEDKIQQKSGLRSVKDLKILAMIESDLQALRLVDRLRASEEIAIIQ